MDEAHSSQSGESTKSLKVVLASSSLEEAEREETGAATPEEELDNAVLAEMEKAAEGDFFVRSGPGTVKLLPDSARECIRSRFGTRVAEEKFDSSIKAVPPT